MNYPEVYQKQISNHQIAYSSQRFSHQAFRFVFAGIHCYDLVYHARLWSAAQDKLLGSNCALGVYILSLGENACPEPVAGSVFSIELTINRPQRA